MNAPEPIHALLASSLQGQLPQLEGAFTRDSHPIVVTDARRRIVWVNPETWLGNMGGQARTEACACHRMPVVANAASVQQVRLHF